MEKSIPIHFSTEQLEKSLKDKRVTSTIRGMAYIKRIGYKKGLRIEIKFKEERVGFAVIKNIRLIGYDDFFDPEIIYKEGFTDSDELINVLKTFWKWQWDKIKNGKMKVPIIEFEWI